MTKLANILLLVDSLARGGPVIAKTERLLKATQSHVHVLHVGYERFFEARPGLAAGDAERMVADQRQALQHELDDTLAPLRAISGSRVDAEVRWERNRHVTWLRAAGEQRFELIIKDASVDTGRRRGLFHTPADWHLLRGARSAVCLAQPTPWSTNPVVLAAIDVEDVAHRRLNEAVCGIATAVTGALGGILHIVHVYPALEEHMRRGARLDYERIEADLRARCRADLLDFAGKFGVDESRQHIVGGRAGMAIPALARSLGAEITVLGTSAHTGLARLFIGTTAEEILHSVNTDIITVPMPDTAGS